MARQNNLDNEVQRYGFADDVLQERSGFSRVVLAPQEPEQEPLGVVIFRVPPVSGPRQVGHDFVESSDNHRYTSYSHNLAEDFEFNEEFRKKTTLLISFQ